jgi:hypothetical protein
MHLKHLRARVRRLERLIVGLNRELALWRTSNHPLLRAERLDYEDGIHHALSGVEQARVALATACRRIQVEQGP